MSWNPFKKAFSARRTRSEDVEFEREVNKLKQMQAVSKRMYKDMKRCNEMETGYLRSKQQLVNGVKSSPLARVEPLRSVVEVLGASIQSFHLHSRELKTNQDDIFIDPIKRLNNVYKQVELYAKQREQKLQEYERQQLKLEKQGRKVSQLQQQQSGSQSKLDLSQRAVLTARTDYERVHDRLMQEIPQLLDGRVNYFDTCLFAVLKAQSLYYNGCSGSIQTCLQSFKVNIDKESDTTGESTSHLAIKSEEDIEQTTLFHLTAVKTLSIVGNPQI